MLTISGSDTFCFSGEFIGDPTILVPYNYISSIPGFYRLRYLYFYMK